MLAAELQQGLSTQPANDTGTPPGATSSEGSSWQLTLPAS